MTGSSSAEAIREQFPILRDRDLHYLDNAATSQVPVAVLEALTAFETGARANVHGGVHRLARKAVELYEGARTSVARFLNAASPDEVVFTNGATSSINLLGHAFGALLDVGDEVVISELEHHSNILPWQRLTARKGVKVRALPVTAEGRLDLDALPDIVTERCKLIALTHCSNVTGALTDVAPIAEAARSVGAKLMLDGAQHAPHGPLDVQALDIDFYAFSGHKTYGPTGIGVLWGRRELLDAMPPFQVGGQMIDQVTLESATFADPPHRFEAGTPPIAGAIGLGAALDWARGLDWQEISTRERQFTEKVLNVLRTLPSVRIVGPETVERRRGVISFETQGREARALGRALDRRGVAIRCGHHCAQPLHAAMGVKETARISLAPYTTGDDVDVALEVLQEELGKR